MAEGCPARASDMVSLGAGVDGRVRRRVNSSRYMISLAAPYVSSLPLYNYKISLRQGKSSQPLDAKEGYLE